MTQTAWIDAGLRFYLRDAFVSLIDAQRLANFATSRLTSIRMTVTPWSEPNGGAGRVDGTHDGMRGL